MIFLFAEYFPIGITTCEVFKVLRIFAEFFYDFELCHVSNRAPIGQVRRKSPTGWKDAGFTGAKKECLDHIEEVWTDMRPLSWRKHWGEKPDR